MSNVEFSAMEFKDRHALKDQIDRHTTAAMLGTCIRTLQRWHHENFGPKRLSKGGPIRYSHAEVEAWIAQHSLGRGASGLPLTANSGHEQRRLQLIAKSRHDLPITQFAINCKSWTPPPHHSICN